MSFFIAKKEGIMEENFVDISLDCCDCGVTFTFTVGEQRYFKSKGLSQPRRCPGCRRHRKETLIKDEGVNDGKVSL